MLLAPLTSHGLYIMVKLVVLNHTNVITFGVGNY